MPLNLPEGKRLAISVGADFDAHSVWHGTFRSVSQTDLSRGEFGAMVGVPRLLNTLAQRGITTTWCIPTHTIQTFRPQVDAIVEHGHEIAAHGVYHEYVPKLELDEERRLLELQLRQHEELLGRRPQGYRSPALDVTPVTLDLLAELDFEWDSSLMGRDVTPYRPRMVEKIDFEQGNTFGPPSRVLELPVSWTLDDFPELETFKGNALMQSADALLRRWTDTFNFAYERCPGGMLAFIVHPQTIGRPANLLMLERFLDHVATHDGVWFATLTQIFECWSDSEPGPVKSSQEDHPFPM
ncbi:polysaccharide deacetylase [Streptomyces sp. NPDC005708]|uniref:polysaccharide deacetylase family protein n=1 Tax=Streptomyces sp. NPDC005708 TaxID=3154564 RepID=UPI0033C838C9